MKIIYKDEYDTAEFDKQRYLESLKRYGTVDEEEFEKAVKEKIECFPTPHVSVLVRVGVNLIQEEEGARKYYEEHKMEGEGFFRLVRVTGYLTGDYRKANDGKLHEFAERTVNGKAGKDGVFTVDEKNMRESAKLAYSAIANELKTKGL